MNTKRITTVLLICVISSWLKAKAGIVDTAITHSVAMHKDVKAVVIKPSDYSAAKKYPCIVSFTWV
jgi:enterochelin esterase-like enzyme